MSKWYLNDLSILEHKKDEVAQRILPKNGENEIEDLNRNINRCRKSGRWAEEI